MIQENNFKRMNSHRFDINNYDDQGYATNVALDFNSDSHSLDDFRFVPIDIVNNEMDRLCKEQWCCSTPQGSPGVGRNTFLSSPHLCFIIVFICDLFVSRDDPLMS